MGRVALVLVGSRALNKRTCRFIESLSDSGFDPVVLALPRRRWGTSGMEAPALAATRGIFTLRGTAGPIGRPELVVCMHWLMLPLALLVKLLTGARVVYDEHDHYEILAYEASGPAWLNRARAWLVRSLHRVCLPHVDVVTCVALVGGELKKRLQRRAPTVVELHNYPSRHWAIAGEDRPPSDGTVAIVYIGAIWAVKGCQAMLDAFLHMTADRSLPAVTLHVFGEGDPAIERRLAAAPGVTLHGATTYDRIVGFLSSRDCVGLVLLDDTPRYALASTNCHKLYEYMASGTAVLATDVGEIGDIATMLDAGWTIEPGFEVEALAARLRRIAAEPQELRRRGDNAAEAIVSNEMWWDIEWLKLSLVDRGRDV
jgi:glycosyltransferase involved in cell wall biosynthesis